MGAAVHIFNSGALGWYRQTLGASQSSQNGKQAPGSETKIESNWKTLGIDVWSPYKVQKIQTIVLYTH